MRVDIKFKSPEIKKPSVLPDWVQRMIDQRMKNLICKECKKHPRQNGSSRCTECSEANKKSHE